MLWELKKLSWHTAQSQRAEKSMKPFSHVHVWDIIMDCLVEQEDAVEFQVMCASGNGEVGGHMEETSILKQKIVISTGGENSPL